MKQACIHWVTTNTSLAGYVSRVIACTILALTVASVTATAAVRQVTSARTPDAHCSRNPDGSIVCDPLPSSLTVTFSSTLSASKLILLAQWFTVTENGTTTGSIGSCTDSLGQSWLYANGQSVFIRPPTNGTIAGITSITCQTAFPNPPVAWGSPSTGKWGVLILHFFEVTGAGPQDGVNGSVSSCSVLPAQNQVTILSDYTGVVSQSYSSSPLLGDYGVRGPSNRGALLDPDGNSVFLILDSIYAAVGGSAATSPLQYPNATICYTVTIPQSEPVENGVNLGKCDECEAAAALEHVAGEPINLTNGNVYITQRDYSLPGLGGGITLERTWNSLWPSAPHTNIPNVRMFGDGWTSNLEERIVAVDGNTVDYWRADGSKYRFRLFFIALNVYYYQLLQPDFNAVQAYLSFDSKVSQWRFGPGDRSQHFFDINGYPISFVDAHGNTTTLTYDAQRRLTQITDAASRSITFSYGSAQNPNQVTSVQDATGTISTYGYDASGRLLQVTYADGAYNRFNYDANGLILSVTDTDGKVLESHTYDVYRRGLTSERANGVERITVAYTTNGVATLSDSAGNTSLYPSATYAGRNVVTGVSGPGCASCGGRGNQTFFYNSYGQRTSSTDALNNTTQFTYDSGNLKSRSITVNGTAVTWSFTYNSDNNVLTATDPLGNVTTNTYDDPTTGLIQPDLLTTTTPSPGGRTAGSKTSFTYDTKGQLLTITDPLLHVTTFTYTAAGLIETVTDAQSKVNRYEYDARGNRTAIVDALNQRTTFAYDSRNRLTSVSYPTTPATSTSFTYDSRGRRTSVTDANGKTTTYTYDDADRLIAVTDAQTPAGVTHYDYDSESNLITITDALGRITRYDYDQQGRVTRTTFPSGLQTYVYDAFGNMLSKTDRKNQTISYTYDALRRLTRKQYPDTTQINYTFDAASRLTQVTDPTGTYHFTYDNMGRLTQTSTAYAFISGHTFTVGYAWDAASNLTSMTDPQGGSTTYTYDTLNRLATLKNPQRNQFNFTYDALGRRTQLARPNSVNTNYQYDPLSRVTSLLHQYTTNKGATTTLDGAQYSYDSAGNRLSKTDKLTNIVSNYTYDPLYELTTVTQGPSTTESYSFDAVGNRLSSLNVPSYTYNASNELTAQTGVTYAYDNNGNLISKTGGTTYSWDFENRLTQVTLPGDSQVNFKYDPMGRRIQKSSASGTVNYIYDQSNVLEEVDTAGTLVTRYTQNLGIDEPLVTLKSGTASYYEADALGTVTSLSNSSGALAKTYSYDSFGRLLSSSGTIANPYGFTGRALDSETGLMYYRARYYDPVIGRFLNEDPIAFAGGENFYRYVDNNPPNFDDPGGLSPCIDINAFVQTLVASAGITSRGQCAIHVRKALEAGGADTEGHPATAKDYGTLLQKNGFSKIASEGYVPRTGDTVVIQPYPGQQSNAGHIQVFDGAHYLSDFRQTYPLNTPGGIYPGPEYRKFKPSYSIYRPTPCPISDAERQIIYQIQK